MSSTKRGATSNYPTMTVQQICDLYTPSSLTGGGKLFAGTLVGHPIAFDAFLNLWATKDVLLEGVAQRVALEWGFTPKQIVPWVKGRVGLAKPRDGCHNLPDPQLFLQMGMGRVFRNCVEYLIVCTRGKYTKLVQAKNQHGMILAEEDTVILAERGRHSEKPDAAYAAIERVMPGPYLELFARRPREGWTVWGNEVTIFGRLNDGTESSYQASGYGVPPFVREEEPPLPLAGVDWPNHPRSCSIWKSNIPTDCDCSRAREARKDDPAVVHAEPEIEWPSSL